MFMKSLLILRKQNFLSSYLLAPMPESWFLSLLCSKGAAAVIINLLLWDIKFCLFMLKKLKVF
jgi:hypothetical protein